MIKNIQMQVVNPPIIVGDMHFLDLSTVQGLNPQTFGINYRHPVY